MFLYIFSLRGSASPGYSHKIWSRIKCRTVLWWPDRGDIKSNQIEYAAIMKIQTRHSRFLLMNHVHLYSSMHRLDRCNTDNNIKLYVFLDRNNLILDAVWCCIVTSMDDTAWTLESKSESALIYDKKTRTKGSRGEYMNGILYHPSWSNFGLTSVKCLPKRQSSYPR